MRTGVCNMSNSKIENYKDNLMHYLVDNGKSQLPHSEELDNYLHLLSFFICKSDPNYLYNLPFLQEQHQKFRDFLNIAPQKYTVLLNSAIELSATIAIKQLLHDPSYHNSSITLSINDFLIINLRNLNNVDFYDHFSIDGATCNYKSDRFTFRVDNFIYAWTCCEKSTHEAIVKISDTVQELFYNKEE